MSNTRTQQIANPWWLAVAVWLGVIAYSSTSAAGVESEQAFFSLSAILLRYIHPNYTEYRLLHFIADKGVHVTMFVVLAILLWKAIPHMRWKGAVILLAGGFVGSCSELLQRLFPNRDPAIRDVLINLGGTALGIAICLAVSYWYRHRTMSRQTPRNRYTSDLLAR